MGLDRVAGTAPRPSHGNTDIAAVREHEQRAAIDQFRVALGGANETVAFIDVVEGDAHDDALELNAELVRDAALDDADALFERSGGDASPEERAQARTNNAPALIDKAPGWYCWPSSPRTSRA